MVTQGGFSQWLQRVTWNTRRVLGNCPFSTYLTQVRLTVRGTWFSVLQATVQAWQPMHLRLSITNPYCIVEGLPQKAEHRVSHQSGTGSTRASPREIPRASPEARTARQAIVTGVELAHVSGLRGSKQRKGGGLCTSGKSCGRP